MEQRKLDDTEYRFGEFGPGYMIRGPRTDLGVVRLRPGDDAVNHYHAALEETFVVIEGEGTAWRDCREKIHLTEGDVIQFAPGEMHYFVNNSETNFRAVFMKAPYDPADGVQVPWVPGEPVPDLVTGA